jgi:molybdate transport system permease protein
LKRELSICYLLTFSRAFSDFGASLILGGGIRGRTWTLPILIYATTYMGGYVAVSTIILIYVALGLAINYFLSGLEEGPRW